MIITTGKPTGYLRTDKQYENFILEFEWFHAPSQERRRRQLRPVRLGRSDPRHGHRLHPLHRSAGPRQSRIADKDKKLVYTSHGDLFSIWGAKCKPDRPHPTAGNAACPARTAARANTNGTTTRSSATTASSSCTSTARKSPASTNATRARAISPSNRKAPSAASRTSRSRSCRARIPSPRKSATSIRA